MEIYEIILTNSLFSFPMSICCLGIFSQVILPLSVFLSLLRLEFQSLDRLSLFLFHKRFNKIRYRGYVLVLVFHGLPT